MNERLDRLIEALRAELQHYGELLALFEKQQEHLMNRESEQVLDSAGHIQSQAVMAQQARDQRVQSQQELADALSVPPDGRFSTLLPALPLSRQGQIQALVDENNRLLRRIQQRAKQNHLLLSHSLEAMGKVIHTLMGTPQGSLYDVAGGASAAAPLRPLYEAVG
ncbi:MAG: flagellar protein FlgN [Verrucomicrobia bacterium]|nr:flagellar protein FlgN [Verrucomicrobiota bacterium]